MTQLPESHEKDYLELLKPYVSDEQKNSEEKNKWSQSTDFSNISNNCTLTPMIVKSYDSY